MSAGREQAGEPPPSIRAAVPAEVEAHRAGHLAQLVAPMDDMWAAFADMGTRHALLVGGEVVGSCSVDEGGQLLHFFVWPPCLRHGTALLRLVLTQLEVEAMMVATLDPGYLSAALDVATRVEPHTLLFAPLAEPEGPGLEGLVPARFDDHARIVDFQVQEIGAPREFLEHYVRERLGREEMLLHLDGGSLISVGELRRDRHQAGIAQLGVIVRRQARGQGVASRMLTSLVERSRAEGLTPHCSTEVTNLGARRAIERAGLRANHRLLKVLASL